MPHLQHWRRDGVAGVLPPPPGITPNFVDPPSIAHVVIAINTAFSVVSTIVVTMRSYTKLSIMCHWEMSDRMPLAFDFWGYDADVIDLLVVSWIFALVWSVLFCIATQFGLGRHMWDVPFSTFNVNYIKTFVAAGTFYGMSIMLAKLSILHFYIQFVIIGSKLRRTIYVAMAIVILYSVLASFAWAIACRPVEKFWDLNTTKGSCINIGAIPIFSGVMNSATDAVILGLPVAFLRRLRLPRRQKIGVMGIMITGGLVVVISVVRLTILVGGLHGSDFSWDGVTEMSLWTVEVHLAIVCACLPHLKPLIRKYLPRMLGTSCGASHPNLTITTDSGH